MVSHRHIFVVIILSVSLETAMSKELSMSSHRSGMEFISGVPKQPASGYRNRGSGGLNNVGGNGNYWCAGPSSSANGRNLNFNSGNVYPLNANNRAYGFSVRPARVFKNRPLSLTMTYTYNDIHAIISKAYHIERKNIRNHFHPLQFEIEQESRIAQISRSLFRREYQTKPYGCFMLEDPTIREVFFPYIDDAVVSHALFALINPIFDRTFIYDSYSCRKGKGTLFGVERMEHFIRSATDNYRREAYALNIDISGFFMAINKGILYSIICDTLERYRYRPISTNTTTTWNDILDFSYIDYLVRLDLFSNPLDNCIMVGDQSPRSRMPKNKSLANSLLGSGVPIGKVTNQLNSTIYLNILDQFVKRVLKAKYYGRYVDDSKIISRDILFLEDCKCAITEFLRTELKLTVHPDKTFISSTDEVFFLGSVLRPYRRYVNNKTLDRFRKCIKLCEGMLSAKNLDLHTILGPINSYLGYLWHFDERKAVRAILENSPLKQYLEFSKEYKYARIIKPKSNMNKSKFGSVPPKTQKLPDGRYRVYVNPVMSTETNIIKHEDTGEETIVEYNVYLCDELDMTDAPTYEKVVEALIRTVYSLSDELSIMRQRDSKPDEFANYNSFAESCKAIAKEWNER